MAIQGVRVGITPGQSVELGQGRGTGLGASGELYFLMKLTVRLGGTGMNLNRILKI